MDRLEPVKNNAAEPPVAEEVEEEPKVPEITQTDHINKAMLNSFKMMLDSNQFRFPEPAQKGEPSQEGDDEFADDGEYDGEDLYDMDPEKAEEERKKAVAFFREMMQSAMESTAAPPASATKP